MYYTNVPTDKKCAWCRKRIFKEMYQGHKEQVWHKKCNEKATDQLISQLIGDGVKQVLLTDMEPSDSHNQTKVG